MYDVLNNKNYDGPTELERNERAAEDAQRKR